MGDPRRYAAVFPYRGRTVPGEERERRSADGRGSRLEGHRLGRRRSRAGGALYPAVLRSLPVPVLQPDAGDGRSRQRRAVCGATDAVNCRLTLTSQWLSKGIVVRDMGNVIRNFSFKTAIMAVQTADKVSY
ncbi:protein of unknown function [Serratia sp. Tan611]|nr:protein of unknown function [Serratia sp. Tan611]